MQEPKGVPASRLTGNSGLDSDERFSIAQQYAEWLDAYLSQDPSKAPPKEYIDHIAALIMDEEKVKHAVMQAKRDETQTSFARWSNIGIVLVSVGLIVFLNQVTVVVLTGLALIGISLAPLISEQVVSSGNRDLKVLHSNISLNEIVGLIFFIATIASFSVLYFRTEELTKPVSNGASLQNRDRNDGSSDDDNIDTLLQNDPVVVLSTLISGFCISACWLSLKRGASTQIRDELQLHEQVTKDELSPTASKSLQFTGMVDKDLDHY